MSALNVIELPVPKVLDLVKDRKDRTTKVYWDHETALTNDIKTAGVRNPIKVVALPDGFYRVVCGQTRLNASRRAGCPTIPAIVIEGPLTPTRLLIEELVDNNMQEGFDILAQGGIYLDLMNENGWTQAELCAHVPAAKPGAVSKALSVFERLVDPLKVKLRAGAFGPRIGYALSRLPADQQDAAYEKVQLLGTVEQAEAHVSGLLGYKPAPKPKGVKLTLPGFCATFTVSDVPSARALLAQIDAALVKVEKHQLPFPSVVQMLKPA